MSFKREKKKGTSEEKSIQIKVLSVFTSRVDETRLIASYLICIV
jgi:hypothetical protein